MKVQRRVVAFAVAAAGCRRDRSLQTSASLLRFVGRAVGETWRLSAPAKRIADR